MYMYIPEYQIKFSRRQLDVTFDKRVLSNLIKKGKIFNLITQLNPLAFSSNGYQRITRSDPI